MRSAAEAAGHGLGAAATAFPPERPWAMPVEDVLAALDVEPARGLGSEEVLRRRRRFGPNQLREVARRSGWRVLVAQFESLIVWLLALASATALLFGERVEALAIGAVVIINAAIGFVTELRAVRSMEALRRLGRVDATVRREGRVGRIPAAELVPGDVMLLEGGDVVTADLRLVEASKLQANESALTGESLPVGKSVEPVPTGSVLSERCDMFYKGTAVTRGSGAGVVVATGMQTELGRISALVASAEPEATPLEKRLDVLGRRLVGITLMVAAGVAAAGLVGGRDPLLVIQISIALAVATVPEGLPIVATLALARGLWRMARRHALVERLSAVETLGSTSLVLSDKTGTLTENRMTAVRLVLDAGGVEVSGVGLEGGFSRAGAALAAAERALLERALRAAVLCNNAELTRAGRDWEAVGDPTEVALLVAGAKAGLSRAALLRDAPELREVSFDPETKLMATVHGSDAGAWVAAKGAPEAVLAVAKRVATCEGPRPLDAESRGTWTARNEALAATGLRVLALAEGRVAGPDADPYGDLELLALVALLDPPRADVRETLAACRRAGIRVVMVTGDQAPTALTVAEAVGLLEDAGPDAREAVDARGLAPLAQLSEAERERLARARVVARASPAQKLELIALHQARGEVVAMTGDGVNDAPALRKADIGVAMGRRGTQVAREAAAMVLQDDRLSTIVAAVEQGRAIFANIRKFVLYLLSCNVSEVLVVALAALVNAPLPILPLQILFLNLVTDVFPALALGVGEGDPGLMRGPPRPGDERILERRHWSAIAGHGASITAVVLGAMAVARLGLGLSLRAAGTVSFLTLAFAQLWHVFNMRERGSGLLRNEITRNAWVWGALALCVVLLAAAVYAPPLAQLLAVEDPGPRGWALVLGASLLPLLLGQLAVWLQVRGARAAP